MTNDDGDITVPRSQINDDSNINVSWLNFRVVMLIYSDFTEFQSLIPKRLQTNFQILAISRENEIPYKTVHYIQYNMQ